MVKSEIFNCFKYLDMFPRPEDLGELPHSNDSWIVPSEVHLWEKQHALVRIFLFGNQPWIWIPDSNNCVTLSKLRKFSEPQTFHLWNKDNRAYLAGLSWGLDIILVIFQVKHLAPRKHSISGCNNTICKIIKSHFIKYRKQLAAIYAQWYGYSSAWVAGRGDFFQSVFQF